MFLCKNFCFLTHFHQMFTAKQSLGLKIGNLPLTATKPKAKGVEIGIFIELYPFNLRSKMAAIRGHSFKVGLYGKNNEKFSHVKLLANWDQTLVKCIFIGHLCECNHLTLGPSKMGHQPTEF